MIPVDIDNFCIEQIGTRTSESISINKIIKYLPREIGNCSSLKALCICDNVIVDISAISNLVSLEMLDLSNNKIADLSILSNFTSLKVLYAEDMKIIKYPVFNHKVNVYYHNYEN